MLGRATELSLEAFVAWAEVHLDDPCAECGEGRCEVDHCVPLSRGGEHALENLQMLCKSCNSRKSAWLEGEVRDCNHLTQYQFGNRAVHD